MPRETEAATGTRTRPTSTATTVNPAQADGTTAANSGAAERPQARDQEGRRHQTDRRGPQADRDRELEDREREEDEDVDDVPPAVRIEELGLGPAADPRPVGPAGRTVERSVGVRLRADAGRPYVIRQRSTRAKTAAGLDAQADDRDPDQPDEQRAAGREAGAQDADREQRDPEARGGWPASPARSPGRSATARRCGRDPTGARRSRPAQGCWRSRSSRGPYHPLGPGGDVTAASDGARPTAVGRVGSDPSRTRPSRIRTTRSQAVADLGVVGDEDERLAVLAVEPAEEGEDLGRALRVEVAGRLVGEDERRPVHQRSGDRHPLLLAAGELGRAMVASAGQPDEVERLVGRRPCGRAAERRRTRRRASRSRGRSGSGRG